MENTKLKKIANFLESIKVKTGETIMRFPGSILCLVIAYILLDLERYAHYDFNNNVYLLVGFGVIITFGVEILLENINRQNLMARLISYFSTYVFLQLYYFVINKNPNQAVFVFIALVSLTLLTFKKRGSFETNIAVMIVRSLVSVFFAVVLYLGVLAILGGIDILLLDVAKDVFLESAQLVFTIILPIIFFEGIPKKGQNLEYPSILRGLIKFIIIPVTIVFTIVLYVYYIKLLITKTLPIGMVGGVSLAFLAVCLPTLVLITPFKEKVAVFLRKWGIFLLIPVVGVLFLAGGIRIAEDGVTFTRYCVIAGGIAVLMCIVVMRIFNSKYQYGVFVIIAAVSIWSGFGIGNMYSVTEKSQQNVLTRVLEKNNMLVDGKIIPNANIPNSEKLKILRSVRYLKNRDLELPSYYTKDLPYKDVFGFSNEYSNEELGYKYYVLDSNIVNINGYDYLNMDFDESISTEKGILNLSHGGDMLKISLNDTVILEESIESVAKNIYENIQEKEKQEHSQDEMSYLCENDDIKLKIIFKEISYEDTKYVYKNYVTVFSLKDNVQM